MSKQPVSAAGGALPPAKRRSLISIQDEINEVRSLVAAADMAAADLDAEQSDPMTVIADRLRSAGDALDKYREAANG